METLSSNISNRDVASLLHRHGVQPTAQRTEIALAIFCNAGHQSADEVYEAVNADATRVSRATIYNTLKLFVDRGMIRPVIVAPGKVFYDPNMAPHYHLYDTDTGELTDIGADQVEIHGLPKLPPDKQLDGVDVVVRMRSHPNSPHGAH